MPRGEKTRFISGLKNPQKLKKQNYLEQESSHKEQEFRSLSDAKKTKKELDKNIFHHKSPQKDRLSSTKKSLSDFKNKYKKAA